MSVEGDDSTPLTSGSRGLFLEDQETGDLDGWVLNGSNWTFKSIRVPAALFNPNQAPDLYSWEDNNEWQCYKERVVFDDVSCSKPVYNNEYYPGRMVRFVGYYSDGNNHYWELGFATDPLIGPEDISPTDACGDDLSDGAIEPNANDDCLSLYLYSTGAL